MMNLSWSLTQRSSLPLNKADPDYLGSKFQSQRFNSPRTSLERVIQPELIQPELIQPDRLKRTETCPIGSAAEPEPEVPSEPAAAGDLSPTSGQTGGIEKLIEQAVRVGESLAAISSDRILKITKSPLDFIQAKPHRLPIGRFDFSGDVQ